MVGHDFQAKTVRNRWPYRWANAAFLCCEVLFVASEPVFLSSGQVPLFIVICLS